MLKDKLIENQKYHPVIKQGVLEKGSSISDFPIESSIDRGFVIALFDYQKVIVFSLCEFSLWLRLTFIVSFHMNSMVILR